CITARPQLTIGDHQWEQTALRSILETTGLITKIALLEPTQRRFHGLLAEPGSPGTMPEAGSNKT
ncbi:MAG: hypothetical protein ACRDR6_11985, partial [Pseudonocardiaceae bacterium]